MSIPISASARSPADAPIPPAAIPPRPHPPRLHETPASAPRPSDSARRCRCKGRGCVSFLRYVTDCISDSSCHGLILNPRDHRRRGVSAGSVHCDVCMTPQISSAESGTMARAMSAARCRSVNDAATLPAPPGCAAPADGSADDVMLLSAQRHDAARAMQVAGEKAGAAIIGSRKNGAMLDQTSRRGCHPALTPAARCARCCRTGWHLGDRDDERAMPRHRFHPPSSRTPRPHTSRIRAWPPART